MEENIKNIEKEIKKNNLNKTWLLVAGLVILTVILLVVSFTAQNIPFNPLSNKGNETNQSHTSLSFSETPRASTTPGTYEMDINVDSRENLVAGAQLELVFDPKFLSNVVIKPGDYLTNPTVLINKINNKDGRVTYAIAIPPQAKAVKGKGTLAVISFTKIKTGETSINFLPHTQIASPGINYSVLKETVSAVIQALPSDSANQPFISPLKTPGSQ